MDLRTPIGLLFTIVGILLTIFGSLHDNGQYIKTGLDIDLIWGIVLLAFGVFMLILARRTGGNAAETAAETPRELGEETPLGPPPRG